MVMGSSVSLRGDESPNSFKSTGTWRVERRCGSQDGSSSLDPDPDAMVKEMEPLVNQGLARSRVVQVGDTPTHTS
jgi:hypothetical protein